MTQSFYLTLIFFGFVLLDSCSVSYKPVQTNARQYRFDANDSILPDAGISSFVRPYREKLSELTKEVLIQSKVEMTKGKPESTLGNFFADAFYQEAQKLTDHPLAFVAQNYGGLRRPSLPKGNINVGHIYELMPFENYIVILHGDSALLQNFFDHIAAHGGWPVSSQLSMKINGNKAVDIRLSGQPLSGGKTYYFALPDYIANGGDRFFFLKEVPRDETGVLIRDAIISHLRKKGKEGVFLLPRLEGRITLL